MATRYRQMTWDPQNRAGIGVWQEFTDADFATKYASHPLGAESTWADLLDSRYTYIEVFRNGDWRPFSNWAVPTWELAARREVAGVERERRLAVGKPQMRLKTARERLDAATATLEDAQRAVKDAEGALKSGEEVVKAAEKTARAIEGRIKALKDGMAKRQAAEDARTPEAALA